MQHLNSCSLGVFKALRTCTQSSFWWLLIQKTQCFHRDQALSSSCSQPIDTEFRRVAKSSRDVFKACFVTSEQLSDAEWYFPPSLEVPSLNHLCMSAVCTAHAFVLRSPRLNCTVMSARMHVLHLKNAPGLPSRQAADGLLITDTILPPYFPPRKNGLFIQADYSGGFLDSYVTMTMLS